MFRIRLTGIHVIAPLSKLAMKRRDCLFRLPPQVQENKKASFSHTAAHIFVFPGDSPAIITQYVAWMERQSMLVKPLAECTYLSSIVSELYDA